MMYLWAADVELTNSNIWVHAFMKEMHDALHMVIKLFILVFLSLLIECFFNGLLTSPTWHPCGIRKKQWQYCSDSMSPKGVALISQGNVCCSSLCVISPWVVFSENCPFKIRIGYWDIKKFAACVGRTKSVWLGTNFVCLSTSENPGDFHCREVTEREETAVFK